VAVVRPEMGLEFAALGVPDEPGRMAFDQDYRQLMVVLPKAGQLAICNPNRGLVDIVLDVAGRPHSVLVP